MLLLNDLRKKKRIKLEKSGKPNLPTSITSENVIVENT